MGNKENTSHLEREKDKSRDNEKEKDKGEQNSFIKKDDKISTSRAL